MSFFEIKQGSSPVILGFPHTGTDVPPAIWERLNDTSPPTLAGFLQAEHPQTAAVVLSELRAEVAASVLTKSTRDPSGVKPTGSQAAGW